MSQLSTLGRRYERLLLLSAPLSIASFLLLFVAVTSTSQKERVTARCYETLATALEGKKAALDKAWEAAKPATKSGLPSSSYVLELHYVNIRSNLGSSCYQLLHDQIESPPRSPLMS
jgi:hypothetical protein